MDSTASEKPLPTAETPKAPAFRLFVGLGNPGMKYAGTRHNAGFMVADALMKLADSCSSSTWQPIEGDLFNTTFNGTGLLVLKPHTFMNSSGEAVKQVVQQFNISPTELLVACDDLDMEVGRIRLRTRGSCGGHRGLASIESSLGTRDFPRLRIGIGRPQPGTQEIIDYVLGAWVSDREADVPSIVLAAAKLAAQNAGKQFREGKTLELGDILPDKVNAKSLGETEVEKVRNCSNSGSPEG